MSPWRVRIAVAEKTCLFKELCVESIARRQGAIRKAGLFS